MLQTGQGSGVDAPCGWLMVLALFSVSEHNVAREPGCVPICSPKSTKVTATANKRHAALPGLARTQTHTQTHAKVYGAAWTRSVVRRA